MATSLQWIAESLTKRLPVSPSASWIISEDSVSLNSKDGTFLIGITQNEAEWRVETEHGHVHRAEAEEAISVVEQLLLDGARFVQEFRGDTLASGWLETKEEDFYLSSDDASFLNPFDADEWVCWPGEQWTQNRYTLHLDTATGQVTESTQRRVADEGRELSGMTAWMEAGLGPADAEMKWTLGPHRRFVFQCPKGWRAIEKNPSHPCLDFHPQVEGLVLRATAVFRDAEPKTEPSAKVAPPTSLKHKVVKSKAVPLTSIEYKIEKSKTDWSCHKWTMLFTDKESQMMGILDLFFLPNKRQVAKAYVDRIKQSAPKSLFAPNDWDMTRGS